MMSGTTADVSIDFGQEEERKGKRKPPKDAKKKKLYDRRKRCVRISRSGPCN